MLKGLKFGTLRGTVEFLRPKAPAKDVSTRSPRYINLLTEQEYRVFNAIDKAKTMRLRLTQEYIMQKTDYSQEVVEKSIERLAVKKYIEKSHRLYQNIRILKHPTQAPDGAVGTPIDKDGKEILPPQKTLIFSWRERRLYAIDPKVEDSISSEDSSQHRRVSPLW